MVKERETQGKKPDECHIKKSIKMNFKITKHYPKKTKELISMQ
jgi:hypothetical protein